MKSLGNGNTFLKYIEFKVKCWYYKRFTFHAYNNFWKGEPSNVLSFCCIEFFSLKRFYI